MAKLHEWVREFPGSITVCDAAGTILELNMNAIDSLRDQGGVKLLGQSLIDCHPTRSKLKRMMRNRRANIYTVTRGRTRKIVIQTPWYKKGKYRGFVEISVPIRSKIPNIVRKT